MINNNYLILRELREQDSKTFFKWINNKELVNYNSNFTPVSQKHHDNWFEKVQTAKNIIVFLLTTVLFYSLHCS